MDDHPALEAPGIVHHEPDVDRLGGYIALRESCVQGIKISMVENQRLAIIRGFGYSDPFVGILL